MKNYLLSLVVFFTVFAIGQNKLKTKSGALSFEASVPAFEEVKAKNEQVSCVFKPQTGEIAALALMKGFRFKVALMEEHFNENYAESDKFTKATFRGKIEGFNVAVLTSEPQEFVLLGKLEFHGRTNEIKTTASVRKATDGIEINTSFSVLASDYDIKIPSLVKNKVTNKVNLKCEFIVKK
ncbi:MAG: hypothetical protein RLZZ312_435 [Bacteroidota bacterium]|jgi:hypothetical protein